MHQNLKNAQLTQTVFAGKIQSLTSTTFLFFGKVYESLHELKIFRIIRFFTFVAVLIWISGCSGSEANQSAVNSTVHTDDPFIEYFNATSERVASLPPESKQRREDMLAKLKSTQTYLELVDSAKVGTEYLPMFTFLSSAIQNTYLSEEGEGSRIDAMLYDLIKDQENGFDKLDFVAYAHALTSNEIGGGLPREILEPLMRHEDKYGMYGEPQVLIGKGGNKTEVLHPFHLTFIFAHIESHNDILDAIYHTNKGTMAGWTKEDPSRPYKYPFMVDRSYYNKMLQTNYPNSKHIVSFEVEVSAEQLYHAYNANEIAADNNFKGKKLAVTGKIAGIGNDIMDNSYITLSTGDRMRRIQCYLDKNEVAKLKKGEVVTVIGKCTGLMVNVLIKDGELWIN